MEFFVGQNMWTDALVLNEHYSHSLPSFTCLVVGIRRKHKVTAACYFSNSASGRWTEQLVELSRLVKLKTEETQLTQLISFGLKTIKKMKESKYNLCISYADYSRNHHGGIYQAASWNYHGKRKRRLSGFILNGEFVHRRSAYSRFGSSSIDILKKHKGEPFYDDGKYLYWKALNKKGKAKAKKLELQKNEYPKPGLLERENKEVQDYQIESEQNKHNIQKLF